MYNLNNIFLTKKSKLLILYYNELEKNLENYITFSQNKNLKDSKKYINFQKYIYNKLDYLYKLTIKDLNLDINIDLTKFRKLYYSKTNEYKSYITKIYNSHFNNNKYITQEIKNYIKNSHYERDNCLLIYNIPYKNKTINFHFFIYKNVGISQKNIEYYDSKVLHMNVLINLITLLTENDSNIFNSLSDKICSKNGLNVYLILTPFERKLKNINKNIIQANNINSILGANHCNGGFCYGCINYGEIFIYRFEEWFKVFCHECLHNFGVDNYIHKFIYEVENGNNDSNKLYHEFLNNFNLNNNINNTTFNIGLQECIVEFWGEFLNNAIYSYNYSKGCNLSNEKNLFKIYLNIFEKIFKYELFHGLLQITKILDFNMMNFERIMKPIDKKQNNYRENSHLFSYYILKNIIIYNYKKFIINPYSINEDNKILFNYDNTLKNMELFFNNIVNNVKSNDFNNLIKLFEELYDFLRDYKDDEKLYFIINNLRMSILEF